MLLYILILHQTTTQALSLLQILLVALYLDSTSNHNMSANVNQSTPLLYILILHQTTTKSFVTFSFLRCFISWFYIKPQLIVILLTKLLSCFISWFYIKPQPYGGGRREDTCCFISWFYIKPQRYGACGFLPLWLLYILILHQTTTPLQ